MTAFRAIKFALAVTIFVFAAVAAYLSFAVVERQEALREVSRYNVVWAASQTLTELHRLEHRVAALRLAQGVDKDEAQLRFEIMNNRLNILRAGDVAAFTEHYPEQRATVDELAAALAAIEPLMANLDGPGVVEAILAKLTPLEAKLTRFAATANQFGGDQVAEDQSALLELHWQFSGAAAGLTLCGLAFIGLLLFQNRVIGRAHDDLRHMTDDLHIAKNAAEAASEAKSRFLANMSHELRTPLNAIIGFSEMIANESLGPIGQAKYREYAADILGSGRHMYELVNDILTMAKLDAGRYELRTAPVDLLHVTEVIISRFKGTEMARGRDIAIEEGGKWPVLQADEKALRQILLNLLSNAVKFSDKGTPVRIAARVEADGDLHLTVADRGIGMTPEQTALAVQPFHQVDNRLARKYEGTGLGLSIVKALIEHHGGRLVIDSTPGVGSRITLVFSKGLIEAPTLAAVA